MNHKIAIIGLGYVGLPLAVSFSKKYKVLGFDINKSRIKELENGIDSTLEVDNKILSSVKRNLKFTSDAKKTKNYNIYIVTVPTPINDDKLPDLKYLIDATRLVGSILSKNDIVIFESTVYPGVTENICVPELEKISGMTYNKDFFCGYSPERVNPGDKINTLERVKKITSGSNKKISDQIDRLYNSIISAGTFKASCIKVAEAAKVIENTQRDLNIALVNELSIIFDKMNLDTLEVLEAAGSKWNFIPFRPGLVGGHCIGVDPYYLTYASEQMGYKPSLILAGRRLNDQMAYYLVNKYIQKMILNGINIKNSTIGVMGITFKENCPDIRNTKIIDIIHELKNWGAKVIVYDPWANKDEVEKSFKIKLSQKNKFKQLDSLIVAVGHNQFRKMTPGYLKSLCKTSKPILADVKSIYDKKNLTDIGFAVFRL